MHLDDLRGRAIAHYFFDELEKIAQDDVSASSEQPALVKNETENQPEEIVRNVQEEATTPGQIFGTEVHKRKDGGVTAFPMIAVPEGMSFRPDLQQVAPNMEQPGWMSNPQEAMASAHQSGYEKGKQEEMLKKVKAEADAFVSSSLQPMGAQQPAVPTQQAQPPKQMNTQTSVG